MKFSHDRGITASSSFEDVLAKLEKTIKRVREHAGAGGQSEEEPEHRETRNDEVIDRGEHGEFREGLKNSSQKAKISSSRPRVKGHASDFEVELVLSMSHQVDDRQKVPASKRAANDIIWRAYATTKSFGAIISGVVATQAVVRRWLAVKTFQQQKRVKVTAATKIEAAWRRYYYQSLYRLAVNNLIRCQSLARCYLARKKVKGMRHDILLSRSTEKRMKEAKMATKISSTWRRYSSQMIYTRIVKDLIVIQSLARVNAARKKAEMMRYERKVACATVIQAKWRAILATKRFVFVQRKVIILQSFVRKVLALMTVERLKEKERIVKGEMATRISSAWKRFHCQKSYNCTKQCVTVCQCIVRRVLAARTLAALRYQRNTNAATLIETGIRRLLLRHHFIQLKTSTILLQSLVRMHAASRLLNVLKDKRRRLEAESVTKISSVWRSYSVRTGYIIVLKAARKHEQRFTAAAIIQAQWRALAEKRSFGEIKSKIVLLQSITRMMIASIRVNRLVSKLKDAANYHSDDYFVYSKKRKEASIKIQTAYRMFTTRKMFVSKKMHSEKLAAAMKIQTTYRKKYLAKKTNDLEQPTGVSTSENRIVLAVPVFVTMFLSMISG